MLFLVIIILIFSKSCPNAGKEEYDAVPYILSNGNIALKCKVCNYISKVIFYSLLNFHFIVINPLK